MNKVRTVFAPVVISIALGMYWTAAAHGQVSGGRLYVASSPTGSPELLDAASGVCDVYVIHDQVFVTDQFASSQFKLDNNAFLGLWLADQSGYQLIGDSQRGVQVSYGGCVATPGVILTVVYFCQGTSGCTSVELAPAFNQPIETRGCSNELFYPVTRQLCVNSVFVIDDSGFGGICECTIPIEYTSWGRVKALFH